MVFFTSCNKESNHQLELEILNGSFSSFENKTNQLDIYESMKDSNIMSKSKNIITYKLTNHSSSTYYFNLNANSSLLSKFDGIPLKDGYLCIYQKDNNKVVNVNNHRMNPNFDENGCYIRNIQISSLLEYPKDLMLHSFKKS